jgi:histidyl-tRNA synthetase
MGIERLVAVMNDDHLFDEINRNDLFLDAYVMPIGEENIDYAFNVTNYIRDNGFNADICLENKSMGQMFKKATRRNSTFGIIIGSEEVQNKEVVLKDLSEQKQIKVKIEDLIDKLDELLGVEEEHEHEHECHCGCGCECKDKKEE